MKENILTNFAYFGSKGKLIYQLLSYIEYGAYNCHTFIDGFGGSGVVTLNINRYWFKRRIINDLNPRLYLIHKTLSDNALANKVLSLVESTELSKECFMQHKETWHPYDKSIIEEFEPMMLAAIKASDADRLKDMWKQFIPEKDIIKLAASALVIFKQSFNGLGKSAKPTAYGNEYKSYDKWIYETLEKVVESMEGVEAYCVNTIALINKYKNDSHVFMYLDSPYELKPRNGKKAYEIDMDDADQIRYVETIIDAKARILISGYKYQGKSIYDKLVETGGWKCEILAEDVAKYSAGSNFGDEKPRVDEWVWFNY